MFCIHKYDYGTKNFFFLSLGRTGRSKGKLRYFSSVVTPFPLSYFVSQRSGIRLVYLAIILERKVFLTFNFVHLYTYTGTWCQWNWISNQHVHLVQQQQISTVQNVHCVSCPSWLCCKHSRRILATCSGAGRHPLKHNIHHCNNCGIMHMCCWRMRY